MPAKKKAVVKKEYDDTDSLDLNDSPVSEPKEKPKAKAKKDDDLQLIMSSHSYNTQLNNLVISLQKELIQVHKSHEQFNELFNKLESFSAESIVKIDNDIKIKEEEIYDRFNKTMKEFNEKEYQLQINYNKKVYDMDHQYQIKLDQAEQEFNHAELEKAITIVNKNKKTILDNEIYDKMTKEMNELKKLNQTIEKDLRNTLEEKYKRELESHIKTKDLESQVQCADMKATIEQQKKEIATLVDTIKTLKSEITEQRNLTKSVAESTQKSVTQNFAK